MGIRSGRLSSEWPSPIGIFIASLVAAERLVANAPRRVFLSRSGETSAYSTAALRRYSVPRLNVANFTSGSYRDLEHRPATKHA